jgi:hypothetical protein
MSSNESNSQSKGDKIEALIRQLPKEKQPQRDLFTGIEYALTTVSSAQALDDSGASTSSKAASKRPIYAIAASVCLVAMVGYFSYQSGASKTGEQLVNQLSAQHAEQKQLLLASFAGTPEKTQNWQQQLQELDDAAAAIKKALENEPNNVALLKMLKKVHEQQIALIERVHAPAWQSI